MKLDIAFFFKKWQQAVTFRKYDEWCENNREEILEEEYACKNAMEPVYWCWQCQYSDCEIH